MSTNTPNFARNSGRRHFIGGSDARIIVGRDEPALLRLWREKRGEVDPEDLSGNLIVCNSASPPKSLIAAGTKPILGGSSQTSSSGCGWRVRGTRSFR